MKDYMQSNKKGLILVAIAIITLSITLMNTRKEKVISAFEAITISYEKLEVNEEKEITEEEKRELVLNEHIEEINFYADTFQIDREVLLERLRREYYTLKLEEQESLGKILIDYLFTLESTEKELFSKKITPCTDDKEYITTLISYFSNIYKTVDYKIAAAIAEIESGYTAPTMLKKNNIFGGMASGNLIKYKNIEYGVLRYIKLLSEGYFEQGLVTIEQIGKVYNPIIDESGIKMANPIWVKNVTNALNNYQELKKVTTVSEVVAIHEAV